MFMSRWLHSVNIIAIAKFSQVENLLIADFFVVILLVDYSKGFGGKYGVQKDRVDKV